VVREVIGQAPRGDHQAAIEEMQNNFRRSKKMENKEELDNYSRQLDPENDAYWQSRGEDERPEDWQERIVQEHV
jgi:hypothetical protein